MTATWKQRISIGNAAEQDFDLWVNQSPGWSVLPYGQGCYQKEFRKLLHATGFNGDSSRIEELLQKLPSDIRDCWISWIERSPLNQWPIMARWEYDRILLFQDTIICGVDIKASSEKYDNHAIMIGSILGSIIQSWSGIAGIYAFPPSRLHSYWTCIDASEILGEYHRSMDGRGDNGSQQPYVLISKFRVKKPLKHVMTEIELQGRSTLTGVIL